MLSSNVALRCARNRCARDLEQVANRQCSPTVIPLQLPINRLFAHLFQQLVSFGEVPAAEEPSMGGERGGVRGGEHMVLAQVYQRALVDGEVAP